MPSATTFPVIATTFASVLKRRSTASIQPSCGRKVVVEEHDDVGSGRRDLAGLDYAVGPAHRRRRAGEYPISPRGRRHRARVWQDNVIASRPEDLPVEGLHNLRDHRCAPSRGEHHLDCEAGRRPRPGPGETRAQPGKRLRRDQRLCGIIGGRTAKGLALRPSDVAGPAAGRRRETRRVGDASLPPATQTPNRRDMSTTFHDPNRSRYPTRRSRP